MSKLLTNKNCLDAIEKLCREATLEYATCDEDPEYFCRCCDAATVEEYYTLKGSSELALEVLHMLDYYTPGESNDDNE